jgi:hypothetical protein
MKIAIDGIDEDDEGGEISAFTGYCLVEVEENSDNVVVNIYTAMFHQVITVSAEGLASANKKKPAKSWTAKAGFFTS